MDFRLTPEQERLQSEVRTWLARELPVEWEATSYDEEVTTSARWARSQEFCRKLAGRGWIAPAWPKEYGGLGASYIEQLIFAEEFAYRRAPTGANINRVGYTGPAIIVYGTDEQKRRFLPGITSAEVFWAQGFSEPNSGSDLASLQTRAVRDGDGFRVSGTKIWTSGAHRADWMILLARTDPDAPKHRGISFLLVDMKTPGISIQPLTNIAGEHGFNQVYLDDVWVSRDCLIGEENRGWYVGATTLDFERSSISGSAGLRRAFDDVVATLQDGRAISQTDRAGLAEFSIEIDVARWIAYRVASMQARGLVPNYEASMSKLFSSELSQRFANFALKLLGQHGLLWPDDPRAPRGGTAVLRYLHAVSSTIAGGSSEIQRNIIANRGLGLPRG